MYFSEHLETSCTIWTTLGTELEKVINMKNVPLCLKYGPVKWFCKINFEEEDITLCLGMVWVAVSASSPNFHVQIA